MDCESPLCRSRRAYERYKMDDSAILILNKKLEKSSILRDLSVRGAGFVCDCLLKSNDKIEIIIKSSLFESSMRKEAKVVWCSKISDNLYRAGLDFGIDNTIDFK